MWHLFQVNEDGSKTWIMQYETEDDAIAAQIDTSVTYSIEFINPETSEDTVVE